MKDNGHLFKPGQSGNPAGKPKGTVHKPHIRRFLTELVEENFEQIKKDFKKLRPKDRVKYWVDVVQYVTPRMQAIGVAHEFKSLLNDNVSDEDRMRIMDLVINDLEKKQLDNSTTKTIDLATNEYEINGAGQPEGQRTEED